MQSVKYGFENYAGSKRAYDSGFKNEIIIVPGFEVYMSRRNRPQYKPAGVYLPPTFIKNADHHNLKALNLRKGYYCVKSDITDRIGDKEYKRLIETARVIKIGNIISVEHNYFVPSLKAGLKNLSQLEEIEQYTYDYLQNNWDSIINACEKYKNADLKQTEKINAEREARKKAGY